MQDSDTKSIKVLAIDGGGIRGIIPAVILGELQDRLGVELNRVFDLISGTSTGGIIALGIGTRCNNDQPYSPQQLLNLYVQNGPAIFKRNWFTSLRALFCPKYSPHALEATLSRFFQDTQFQTALTPLLISSYDLQGQLPFFFKSHKITEKRRKKEEDYNWPVASIARATSAAPTFFPPLHVKKGNHDYALVDGGVFVNNPSMAAYAEARSVYPDFPRFVVVSVGTGDRQDHIAYARAKGWGLLGWAKQIVPVFMDSVSEAVDYELSLIPGCTFHRLQLSPLSPASNEMDDVTPQNLSNLQAVAKEFVSSAPISNLLNTICTELKEGRGSNMPGIGR